MNRKHLLDPDLLPFLDGLPKLTYSDETLDEARLASKSAFSEYPQPASNVTVESLKAPGLPKQPHVELSVYRPAKSDPSKLLGGILHIHGGGFFTGSVQDYDFIPRGIAAEAHCIVVSVDYRLAPETRFPGALLDCYAGLVWLHSNCRSLGIDAHRIGVKGESAGGGLAAALALLARDRGEFALAFQHLTYPMLDDRTAVRKEHSTIGEYVWTASDNHYGWSCLLGIAPGSDSVSKLAAPARETDFTQLPPTYLATGALDLFVEENIDYAARLCKAGVATELHVWPGAFHGFDFCIGSRVAEAYKASSLSALRRLLAE